MLGNCLRIGKCDLRGEFDQRAGDDADLRLPVAGQFAGEQPANGGLRGEVGASNGDEGGPLIKISREVDQHMLIGFILNLQTEDVFAADSARIAVAQFGSAMETESG